MQRPVRAAVELDLHQGVVRRLLLDLHVAYLAGADAGDLHVASVDHAEGVVELHPVARVLLAAAGAERERRREGDEHQTGGCPQHPPHGPSGTSDGSHGKPGYQ